MESYNIYCDESCHLEKDHNSVMVLGAIACPNEEKTQIYNEIRRIKTWHGLSSYFEIKWTKVSQAKIDFYIDILEYFFSNQFLSYRCVVATGKDQLDHESFNGGEYDQWYYKMYYYLLRSMTPPNRQYRIFIDIKDTRGGPKTRRLHDILCSSKWDFEKEIITDITQINSHESELVQIVDLLNGAMAYYYRQLQFSSDSNMGKNNIVSFLEQTKKLDLSKSTSPYESKYNIFVWKPRRTY